MYVVSIIIPVYNTEKYLARCLQSAIDQTLKDIEIIVINDASVDSSLQIIKYFMAKDNRIKLIDLQENKGNGFARNEGIKRAKGKYIMFLDSDDWYESNTVEIVYKKAQKSNYQIVLFGHTIHTQYARNKKTPLLIEDDPDFYRHFLLTTKGVHSYPTIYCFLRAFIVKHSIKFAEGGVYLEDVIFIAKALLHVRRIGIIAAPLYNYRKRRGSIMNSVSKKKIDDSYTSLNSVKKLLLDHGMYETYHKEYIFRLLYYTYNCFLDYFKMRKKDADEELNVFMTKLIHSNIFSEDNMELYKNIFNEIKIFESKATLRRFQSSEKLLRSLNNPSNYPYVKFVYRLFYRFGRAS